MHRFYDKTYEAAVSITHEAVTVLGLDDPARYADLDRPAANARFQWFAGTREAIVDLVTELNDRATEGDGGFDESPRNKAICRRAVARIRRHHQIEPRA